VPIYDPTILKIEERSNGLTLVHIEGDLDSMGTHMVQNDFTGAAKGSKDDVIVDLSKVGFISSAGMAMLLVKGKALRKNGQKLVIAAASTRVLEVLSLAGFHELFDLYPTLEAAIAKLQNES
jgi:anti-sigma B factor antagonist